MNTAKKSAVAAALTAGLIGGGVGGAILGTAGISGAQEGTTTTVAPESDTGSDTDAERPDPSTRLGEALAPLVEAGTITQAQADAVVAALVEAGPRKGDHGPRGEGPGWDAAAQALGLSTDELQSALRGGQTLAQIAEAEGVDPQVIIDTLIAATSTHLDERVDAGEITREQADERLAEATERIPERVENGRPEGDERGGRHGRGGGHGRHGGPSDGAADDSAPEGD